MINRLIIFLTLLSCGNKAVLNNQTMVTRPSVGTINNSDFGKFAAKFKNLSPACSGKIECPDNLVFLGFFNPSTSVGNYCNGLIVSKDQVVVPSKCVPRTLRSSVGLDCSKAVILKDPKSRKHYNCKRVTEIELGNRSGKYEPSSIISDRDYIVFEFPGIALHQKHDFNFDAGFQFKKDYNLYYYEISEREKKLNLKKNTCTANSNTYLSPLSNSKFSPNISVHCPSENLDRKELIGAVLADGKKSLGYYYRPIAKSLLRSLRSSQEIIFDDTLISANGSWMNFSCWEFLNPNPSNECFVDYSIDKVGSQRAYLLDFKISNEDLYNRNLSEVQKKYLTKDQFVNWDIVIKNVGLSYELTPKEQCFHKVKQWPEDMKKKFVYDIELNKHIVFPRITNSFEVTTKIIEKPKFIYTIKFNSKHVKRSGMSDIEIILSHYDIYGNRRFIKKDKIKNFPVCK